MNLVNPGMKLQLKMIIGFLFLSMAFQMQVQAQDDYVVTIAGDTILGKINIFFDANSIIDQLSLKVKEGKKRSFKAIQIRGFLSDSEEYRTIKFLNKYQFMKVEMVGYLSLLRFRAPGESMFNRQLLHKMDGSQLEVPRLSFKKSMSKFLSDCSVLVDKIQMKEYKLSNLEKVIEEYNGCIDDKSGNLMSITSLEVKSIPKEVEDLKGDDQGGNTVLVSLNEIKSKFESEGFESADFNSIYVDIRQKVIDEEAIPNYLINALKDSVAQSDEVTTMVTEFADSLPK